MTRDLIKVLPMNDYVIREHKIAAVAEVVTAADPGKAQPAHAGQHPAEHLDRAGVVVGPEKP